MKELYQKALEAYTKMLMIHIDTKTLDTDFHQATESFYETLFDTTHKIGEKHVDLGGSFEGSSLEEKKQQANAIISQLREDIEMYTAENDMTLGTDDLLGSLANSLEDIEGTSKSFL